MGTQWCLAVGVTLAVVTVVPYALFKCYQYLFPAKEAEPIKQVEPVVEKPVAKPTAPVTAPVKTPEEPVVEPKSYGNMIIIALIVACVIGMLISVYFVCIKKDEEDIDIEDPEAPASGNQRKTSKGSADIRSAEDRKDQAASKDE